MATRTPVNSNHICLDERGVAYVGNTRFKVMHVVMDRVGNNLTPEQIVENYPGALTLAEVHAALAYYYDHQAEIDEAIRRSTEEYDRLIAQRGESSTLKKARAMGLRP